jgi:hypothetical protein
VRVDRLTTGRRRRRCCPRQPAALACWLQQLPAANRSTAAAMAVSVVGNAGIEWQIAAVCLVGIIMFTIALETGIHKLEHSLHEYPHYMHMVEAVYREVMILGLISYGIFMLEQYKVLDISQDGQLTWVVCFEFSHILLFYMALFFVAKSYIIMRVCQSSSKQWDRLNHESFAETLRAFEGRGEVSYAEKVLGKCKRVSIGDASAQRQDLTWQLIALNFVRICKIPIKNFDVAKYMRKSLSKKVAHKIHVPVITWITTGGALVILFVLWGYSYGCERQECVKAFKEDYEGDAGGNMSAGGRRALGAGAGGSAEYDEDTSRVLIYMFGGIGWLMLFLMYGIARWTAWREMAFFRLDLGWTEDDQARAIYKRLKSELELLAEEAMNNDSLFELPEMREGAEESNWEKFLDQAADSLILLNCFYLAIYILQIMAAMGWTGWSIGIKVAANIFCVFPVITNLAYFGPAILKSHSVLESIKSVDPEVVCVCCAPPCMPSLHRSLPCSR